MLPSVLVFGFSHIGAVMRAAQSAPSQQFDLVSLDLHLDKRHQPIFTSFKGTRSYNKAIQSDMEEILDKQRIIAILASLWRAQDYLTSIADEGRPFDFVLPDYPHRAMDPDAEVIPYDLMHTYLKSRIEGYLGLVEFFRTFTNLPILMLSAPPPNKGVTDVQQALSSELLDSKLRNCRVPPPERRYKLWKLCESIYKQLCMEAGVPFLAAPSETVASDGFRTKEYFGNDWMHASTSYGELVLRQTEKSIAKYF